MIKIAAFTLLVVISAVYAENKAVVQLWSDDTNVKGTINFEQVGENVVVKGFVDGLTPGKHGFHVHDKGDISNKCLAAAGHFNPYAKHHGAPSAAERHVGDLGNIEADDKGHAVIDITDGQISLIAVKTNIIGRSVVVHSGEDDLGLTDHPDSKTTGNAGGRIACGVIGIHSDDWSWESSSSTQGPTTFLILALFICSLFVTLRVQ